jgi:hypothetical protein
LGSNGIPYVIDSFALAGKLPMKDDPASDDREESWKKDLLPNAESAAWAVAARL